MNKIFLIKFAPVPFVNIRFITFDIAKQIEKYFKLRHAIRNVDRQNT